MLKKIVMSLIILLIAFTILFRSIYGIIRQQHQLTNEPERQDKTEEEVVGRLPEQQGEWQPSPVIPALSPRPTEAPPTPAEVTDYIKEVFGGDVSWAIGVAICESGLNHRAVNPTGKYIGLYQFSIGTWNSNCTGERENWQDQTRCAKELYDKGETGHWPNCP